MKLDPIKKRAEAATKGPWWERKCHGGAFDVMAHFADGSPMVLCARNAFEEIQQECHANADFIAHAREDIPALISEVERLRRAVSIGVESLTKIWDNRGGLPGDIVGICAETREILQEALKDTGE